MRKTNLFSDSDNSEKPSDPAKKSNGIGRITYIMTAR